MMSLSPRSFDETRRINVLASNLNALPPCSQRQDKDSTQSSLRRSVFSVLKALRLGRPQRISISLQTLGAGVRCVIPLHSSTSSSPRGNSSADGRIRGVKQGALGKRQVCQSRNENQRQPT